jgi:hypothetical protein
MSSHATCRIEFQSKSEIITNHRTRGSDFQGATKNYELNFYEAMYDLVMPHTLNMTLPLKQDSASLAALQNLKTNFATMAQGAIDAALAKSQLVHFARVVVIDDKYIQVLTEYDGEVEVYTEFFRKELQQVFKLIFSLGEGVPDWDSMNNPDDFFKVSAGYNVRSLGDSKENIPNEGYLFCAYPGKLVPEIQKAVGIQTLQAGA